MVTVIKPPTRPSLQQILSIPVPPVSPEPFPDPLHFSLGSNVYILYLFISRVYSGVLLLVELVDVPRQTQDSFAVYLLSLTSCQQPSCGTLFGPNPLSTHPIF